MAFEKLKIEVPELLSKPDSTLSTQLAYEKAFQDLVNEYGRSKAASNINQIRCGYFTN